MDDYKEDFQIKFLYDFVEGFENINYIDKKVIIDWISKNLVLKIKTEYDVTENTIIFYEGKADSFIDEIRHSIRLKLYDFSKIITFLNKAGIKFVVKQTRENIHDKKKIIYRNRNKFKYLDIEDNLINLDYAEIKKFITNIEDSDVSNNCKLHMEKAYAMYFVEEYYDAYKEYKKISEYALKNKEFIIYAISEFNRYYVGRIAKNYYHYLNNQISKRVEEEIQKIELDKILLKFTFKAEELDFLKELLNWNFVNSKTHKMVEIKQKIDKDENTCYAWIDKNSIGIFQLQNHIKNFWKFIKYNVLAIDRYSEVKWIFYNYIDEVIKNYTIPKIHIDVENSFFGSASENVKIEELTLFELIIMLEHINTKELENIFQRYEIKRVRIKEEDVEQFIVIIKNCIQYLKTKKYHYVNVDINKILLMFTVIELNDNQYNDVNDNIVDYINNDGISLSEFKYLNKYIYYQHERFNNYDLDTLVEVLFKVLESTREDGHIYNEQINIVNNISYYIKKNSKDYKLKNIVNELIENLDDKWYIILLNLYCILNPNDRKIVKKLIKDKLNNIKFSEKHCEIYYESVMRKIIKPNIVYENKYFNCMKEMKYKKEKQTAIRSYPDYLEELLNLTTNLILSNYIIEKERFKNFLGIKDEYDFLYNIEEFDISKFKLKWLDSYSESLVKQISENKKIKQEIKKKIDRMILNDEKIDNGLLKKYVKYFSF